jgi:hypothetical protein
MVPRHREASCLPDRILHRHLDEEQMSKIEDSTDEQEKQRRDQGELQQRTPALGISSIGTSQFLCGPRKCKQHFWLRRRELARNKWLGNHYMFHRPTRGTAAQNSYLRLMHTLAQKRVFVNFFIISNLEGITFGGYGKSSLQVLPD